MPHKEKNAARQGMGRRHSKRSEKNVQNTERSMDGHRNRKGGYALLQKSNYQIMTWRYNKIPVQRTT